MGRLKKYNTEEERIQANREAFRRYYYAHQDKIIERRNNNKQYMKEYYCKRAEKNYEYTKMYNKTPKGRAVYLLNRYKQSDKEHNRGEGDLTSQWIVENIFSQPCAHCGETDWRKIGCNRLDNSKPHTKDNVEPCCGKCNIQLFNKRKMELRSL